MASKKWKMKKMKNFMKFWEYLLIKLIKLITVNILKINFRFIILNLILSSAQRKEKKRQN